MFGHFFKWRSEIPLGGGDMRLLYRHERGGHSPHAKALWQDLAWYWGVGGTSRRRKGEQREGGEVREVTEWAGRAGPMDASGFGLLK